MCFILYLSLRLTKSNKKERKNNGKKSNFSKLENTSQNPTPYSPPPPKNCLPNNSDIWIIEDIENQHTLIQSSSKAWASQNGSIMVLK